MKGTTVITDFKDLKKAIIEVTKNKPAKSREQLQYEKMQPLKEGKLGDSIIRKDFPNVWSASAKDKNVLKKFHAKVNTKNYKQMKDAYKKDMKSFVDSFKEGFASDAQRRAAFASGYKAKGKKGKKESVNESEFHMFGNKKDAEKKAKEINGKVVIGKGKSKGQFMAVKESFDEAKVLRFTKIVDKSLEKHLKFVTKKIGADMKKIPGGFEVGGPDDRGLNAVVDYVFDKSIKKGLLDGGGMSQVNFVKESMADFMSGVIKVQQSYSDVKKAENMLKMFARDGLIGYNGPMRGQVGSDSFIIVGKKKDVKLVLNKMSRIASTPVKELPMPKVTLVKADVVKEDSQDLQEGTWAIPDSKRKLAVLVDMLRKPYPATTQKDLDKFMNMLPIGDDILYDDLDEVMYEKEPDGSIKRPLVKMRKFPKVFLNVIAGESLNGRWIKGKTQGNKFNTTHHYFGPDAEMESVEELKKPKRKSGNIRRGKLMKLDSDII